MNKEAFNKGFVKRALGAGKGALIGGGLGVGAGGILGGATSLDPDAYNQQLANLQFHEKLDQLIDQLK